MHAAAVGTMLQAGFRRQTVILLSPARQGLSDETDHHDGTPHHTNGKCLLGQALEACIHPISGYQIDQPDDEPAIVALYPLIK